MDIPDGMMESRWNLAIPCEFHVEYRLNGITKKSGIPAKIYSIWNEWNPSGIRWIPLGFHVEYIGRVKTSVPEPACFPNLVLP